MTKLKIKTPWTLIKDGLQFLVIAFVASLFIAFIGIFIAGPDAFLSAWRRSFIILAGIIFLKQLLAIVTASYVVGKISKKFNTDTDTARNAINFGLMDVNDYKTWSPDEFKKWFDEVWLTNISRKFESKQ